MHSGRLEPTKLILLGTRTIDQATGDAGSYVYIYIPAVRNMRRVNKLKKTHLWRLSMVGGTQIKRIPNRSMGVSL